MKNTVLYQAYVQDLIKKNAHYLTLPLIIRLYLSRHLDSFLQLISWTSSFKEPASCFDDLSRIMIIGGYEGVAEAYAITDYLQSKYPNMDFTSRLEFDILPWMRKCNSSESKTTSTNMPKVNHYDLPSFFDDQNNSSNNKYCSEEWEDRIRNTKLFVFSNMFCYYTPRLHKFALCFLNIIFQLANENSCFLFISMPMAKKKQNSTADACKNDNSIYNLVTTATEGKLALSSLINQSLPNTNCSLDIFMAWKPPKFRLPDSFYSTISYIRANVLSYYADHPEETCVRTILTKISNNDVLNIETLIKSPKFSMEMAEFDQANCEKYLYIVSACRDCLDIGNFAQMETSMKRHLLLNWFFDISAKSIAIDT